MGLQDFGWVYHHPDKPPAKCSCKQPLIRVNWAFVCPKCDAIEWWPSLGPLTA